MREQWITNRPPTEADADEDGDVMIPDMPPGAWCKDYTLMGTGWRCKDYTLIATGQPWWSEKADERAGVDPVAVPAPTLRFALGQLWRCRNGDLARVTRVDPGTDLPVCDHKGYWHRADGTSCINCSDDDLIELVSGTEPAPAPCLKSLTDDQLYAHHVAVQSEILRRAVPRCIVEAKRPGGLLA